MASRPCRDFDLPGLRWSGRGGDGIRVACFVGPAVPDEVHARVGHAWASDGSVPRRGRGKSFEGCALGLAASRPGGALAGVLGRRCSRTELYL